jgi:hypothetical protein
MDNRVCRRVGFVVLSHTGCAYLLQSVRMPTVPRYRIDSISIATSQTNRRTYVDRDDLSAKFWLDPVALARSFGFNAGELGLLYGIIVEHQQQLLEASAWVFWHSARMKE